MRNRTLLLAALANFVLAGWGGTDARGAERENETETTLRLDAQARHALGIEIAKVALQPFVDELRAPGEVHADAYRTVLVTPRMSAQVLARNARLGDLVQARQHLATLTSIELAEAQGALIVADREWQRVDALGPEAVSGRRYLEAQVARDQALAKARAFNMSAAQIAQLLKAGSARATGALEVLAPQAGRITTDEFLIGERVEPGRVLFTIVDPSTVWVEAQLSPEAAAGIAIGAAARIIANGTSLPGKVIQRAQSAEESTRTVSLRIEVANPDERLVSGQFVEALITVGAANPVLAVPSDAVTQVQGEPVVFKLQVDSEFEPTPVRTGDTRGAWTAVLDGVAEGDTIAVKGIYTLKARLLKSQIGEDDD